MATKYRYSYMEQDFPGTGLCYDGNLFTYHEVWRLTDKRYNYTVKPEVLENYVPPTEKQIAFLKKYTLQTDDFINSRTRQECINWIRDVITARNYQAELAVKYVDENYDDDGNDDAQRGGI